MMIVDNVAECKPNPTSDLFFEMDKSEYEIAMSHVNDKQKIKLN